MRLLVDFVPNHVAPDHPWLTDHPEYFVQGNADDLASDPTGFLAVGDAVIARGRDPFFPPWPDVAQLNGFAPGLRQAATDTLLDIADQADGVRCDMAMLLLNEVFARTWGERAGGVPEQEYWTEVIGSVRARHPDFVFAAEAYWDLEWDLQQLGFDYCYDKRLYDRLIHDDVRRDPRAPPRRPRLPTAPGALPREPRRAACRHGVRRRRSERAAAVAIATLARRHHVARGPVRRLARAPTGVPRPPAGGTGRRRPPTLPPRTDRRGRRPATRPLGSCATPAGGRTTRATRQLLAWSWIDDEQRTLVVINFADAPAAARIHLPWDDLAGASWRLDDLLTDRTFTRDGADLAGDGLFVQLPPFGYHVLGACIA